MVLAKAGGWFGPPKGTHTAKSTGLDTLARARQWWADNLGGKSLEVDCETGGKIIPLRIEFDATIPDAYTDSQDESGNKLPKRLFSAKRAAAMDRILPTIHHPKRRLRNYGADLLLEAVSNREHFTVVLKWNAVRKNYGFTSSHFKSIEEVQRLQRNQDPGKNNGPLQKSEPFCAGPSVFKAHYEAGVSPTGSQLLDVAPTRDCTPIIGDFGHFSKALPLDFSSSADLLKAGNKPPGDDPLWSPHESPFIRWLIEQWTAKGVNRFGALQAELAQWLNFARHKGGPKVRKPPPSEFAAWTLTSVCV
jgi:hypothetical protein